MSDAILLAENLHKGFQMGRSQLRVLSGANLRVQPGEFVAIMGKSGSGKSTLLHILGALDAPQTGEVYLNGQPICHPQTLAARWGARIDQVVRVGRRIISILLKFVYVPGMVLFLIALALLPAARQYQTEFLWAILGGLALLPASLLLLLAGIGLRDLVEHRRIGARRHLFGFVFQFYHLLPELNVLENVVLPRMVRTFPWDWFADSAAARADALHMLTRVGLADRLKHRPNELSGGERQRVAIARALVHKPKILFADEPTGNLDAEAGGKIMELISELHKEGQTIVMVTHDPSVARYADRTLLLEDGRLRSLT